MTRVSSDFFVPSDEPSALTVGDDLERRRLAESARRLEHVVAVLRRRVEVLDCERRERTRLNRALRDFAQELDTVRAHLRRPVRPREPSAQ